MLNSHLPVDRSKAMEKFVRLSVGVITTVVLSCLGYGQVTALTPYAKATLLDASDSESSISYDFITGPADKIKRDVIIENSLRVSGRVLKSTYELPAGVKRTEVFSHYQELLRQIEAQHLFVCDGRDCGRSTIWASEIFQRRDLSAPTRTQEYSASVLMQDGQQTLFAVYVVARGNLRVMAHIEQVVVDEPVTFDNNQTLRDELLRRGSVMLKDIKPSLSGALTATDLEEIVAIVEDLSLLDTQQIYVVCHLHGSRATQALLDASTKCAESVVEVIVENTTNQAFAFGTGPLIPHETRPLTRVELVVPALVRRE